MKIRVSFTYEPKPEYYQYEHNGDNPTAKEMAAFEQAAYDDAEFGLGDLVSDETKVVFEVVEE